MAALANGKTPNGKQNPKNPKQLDKGKPPEVGDDDELEPEEGEEDEKLEEEETS